MLLNLATLSLVLTVASAPDSIRRAPSISAPPDSGRIVHRDSTPPLARRTMARVGFGAESERNVAARESAAPPTDTTQRRHAVAVVGAMVALGMSAERAVALPFVFVTGARLPNGTDVSFPIPTTDGATIDRNNDMFLAGYQGKVYAFGLACPHQNTALRWLAEEGRFQCPKHTSKYAPDGTFLSGRATRSMDRYAARKDGSNVVVNLDTMYQEDKQKPEWENAFVPA